MSITSTPVIPTINQTMTTTMTTSNSFESISSPSNSMEAIKNNMPATTRTTTTTTISTIASSSTLSFIGFTSDTDTDTDTDDDDDDEIKINDKTEISYIGNSNYSPAISYSPRLVQYSTIEQRLELYHKKNGDIIDLSKPAHMCIGEHKSVGMQWMYRMLRNIKETDENDLSQIDATPLYWIKRRENAAGLHDMSFEYRDRWRERPSVDFELHDDSNDIVNCSAMDSRVDKNTFIALDPNAVTHLSLSQVLENKSYRSVFGKYMKSQFSEENLEFLEAVEEYKRITLEQKDVAGIDSILADSILKLAHNTFETFVSSKADKQVNLPGQCRSCIAAKLKKCEVVPEPDLFDESETIIFDMVEKDVFVRFCESQEYFQMLHSGKDIDPTLLKGIGWKNSMDYRFLNVDIDKVRNATSKIYAAYCTLNVDSKKYTTKSSKDCIWYEKVQFPIHQTTQFIEISLYNTPKMGSSEKIGSVYIKLETIKVPFRQAWYNVTPSKSKNSLDKVGEISLRITFSSEIANNERKIIGDGPKKKSPLKLIKKTVSKKKEKI